MNLSFCTQNQWIVISAVIGIVTYYFVKWSRALNYWKSRNIKNPSALPIFGNALSAFFQPQPKVDHERYQKFGRIFGFYQLDKPVLTVGEPELIKQILVKDFNLFRNRRDNGCRHEILSKHMFIARGDDWKRIRPIASPTFTSGKLKNMYSLINKCCADFIKDLEEKVDSKREIELKQLMGTYSMDVISRCAFASNTNTYKDPNNEFITAGTNVFNIPSWKMLLLFALPGFITKISAISSVLIDTDNPMFFVNFAAKVMKHRRDNNEKHNDFLQLLMDVQRTCHESRDENEAHHINEGEKELRADKEVFSNEKKLTENEILAQCFFFFIAGFETTATTLSYCTYELALNPEIQERLYQETKDAFDENGEIKYEVLLKLPYLDAVISETLRNYPPLIRLEREAMEEVNLGDSGLKIEKGIVAEIPIYAIHHDPEHFPEPFVFNPDRFLPENKDKIKPYTYLPFGSGPRNCIGMRFGLLEAKLALAKLSQKFKFSRVDKTDVPVIFNKGGIGFLIVKQLIVGIEKR